MKVHVLKTKPEFYDRMFEGFFVNVRGGKTAEIRENDREYQVGDYLLLVRNVDYSNMEKLNPSISVEITDILSSDEYPEGLKSGYAMLSLRKTSEKEHDLVRYLAFEQMEIKDLKREIVNLREERVAL